MDPQERATLHEFTDATGIGLALAHAEACEWPVGPYDGSHPCDRPATRLLVRYPVQELATRFVSERRAYCALHMKPDREALAREAGYLVVAL
jgi:hypothetical protein